MSILTDYKTSLAGVASILSALGVLATGFSKGALDNTTLATAIAIAFVLGAMPGAGALFYRCFRSPFRKG